MSRVDSIRASKPTTFRSVTVPSSFLVECTDGRTLTVEFQLAPSAKPKGIDLVLDLQGKPQIYRGIYEIAGDTLKLCVSLPEKDRPTEFSANAGTKRVLLTLRRPPGLKADEPKTEKTGAGGNSTKSGPAVARWEEIIRLEGHKSPVRWMGCSPDATLLATGEADGRVYVWDVAKAKKIRSLDSEPIRFVAFTPDGKQLVTAGPGRGHALQVRLRDPVTGNPQAQLGAGGDFVALVALSPDGKLMVTSSSEKSVQAFALDGTSLKRIWSANLGFRVTGIAISPDGQRIAVVGGGASVFDHSGPADHPIPDRMQLLDTLGELRLLDAATGKAVFSIKNPIGLMAFRKGAAGAIATVAFSPDGKLLASSNGADGTLWLHDAQTGKDVRELKGHADCVTSLAFSPDGKLLASCGADYKVRIWDPATGQERAALPLASPANVLFSPDNQFLAASGGGVVRLWRERQARDMPPMPAQIEPKKDAAK
ncbi:MAG: TIGR03067 domain-containing protein [Planctomycetes bacterium]|nr:TIGR03067 domain-containing protein [Planctomycetota bacterium]